MLGEIASPSATSPDSKVKSLRVRRARAARGSDEVVVVAHRVLLSADSPRIGGQDIEHVRALAEQSGPLPPILVHRSTMRVIDGMHRLRASALRGEADIAVRFFDGTTEEAFILAVRSNAKHGLPLSQVDRAAAASRILTSHPDLSDNAVAALAGISDKTVATMRSRSTAELPKSNRRRGRDGRLRPVNPVDGRRKAADYLTDHPNATIREIAEAAGIAPATAQDVRKRRDAGQDPLPRRLRSATTHASSNPPRQTDAPIPPQTPSDLHPVITGRQQALAALKAEPSLRLTDAGRTVLRMLDAHTVDADFYVQLADNVPTHCLPSVLEVARGCAEAWTSLVKDLEGRSTTQHPRSVLRTTHTTESDLPA